MSVNWWVKTYSGDCVIKSIDKIHPESIVELTTCSEIDGTNEWVACLLPIIKVGLVSGANQIFEHNGLIEQDTINIICSDYFNTKIKKKYYFTENQEHPVLKIYKDKLINRKIREFGEHNWHEWGAIRNINIMKEMKNTPCIYVNCKTRKKNSFFIDKVDYFDGSMLCLIPTQNLNLEHWRDILNNNDKLFKIQGMLVGKRYSFTQKTLSNFRF